ncbi:DNA alkylation repair protein [Treponema pedis]|uniref:DNA alkylation repair protein n=1 Tax=Treponema pedis TaxID=409322 RepID=UPI000427D3EE|nr:DNA alkylation repair protein [Treponema pedis]
MHNKKNIIQTKLFSFEDKAYRDFNKKLIPNINENTMIGIRTPVLRKFAKEFFKAEPELTAVFMRELPHVYFEENNLHAFFIENIKEYKSAMEETEKFLPYIDNWATCDSFSPKIFKTEHTKVYKKILVWIKSKHCYTVRYAIGLLLSNYLDELFNGEMLELVSKVRSEEYYVNMMIAWYFSFALIKQYDKALPYIQNRRLAPFTHNKAIQKAIESYRIPKEIKDKLRTMKIKQP